MFFERKVFNEGVCGGGMKTKQEKAGGQRHRTTEQRESLIRGYDLRGLKKEEFCRKHNIHPSTLERWLRKQRLRTHLEEKKKKEGVVGFAEVQVGWRAKISVEIVLPNGISVRVCEAAMLKELRGPISLVHL